MNEPTLEPEFKAFKDGVYDAIIHGSMDDKYDEHDEPKSENYRHYYKRGYDFGMTVYFVKDPLGADKEEEE